MKINNIKKINRLVFLIIVFAISLSACGYRTAHFRNNNKVVLYTEANDEFNKALNNYYETIESAESNYEIVDNGEDTYFFNPDKKFNDGIKEEDSVNVHEKLFDESLIEVSIVKMDNKFKYATYSVIQTGEAKLYKYKDNDKNRKTVCINAGHGTPNGSAYNTFSHPDFSPKVTGGTTKAGSILSIAVSDGMIFDDGHRESEMNLIVAVMLKDLLLKHGYNVLMIREDEMCYLDNVARTVLANNYSDIHVSIHFDSTANDKGFFYIGPPNIPQYVEMDPVKKYIDKHRKLGSTILKAFKEDNYRIFGSGHMGMDLTQISYSTIASVDIELGDKATNLTPEFLSGCARTLYKGIDNYFLGK